jgi:hypothetical protein
MLKKSASGVLTSLRDSTYRSVRLASALAAALLDGLFEHPADYPGTITLRIITTPVAQKPSFSANFYCNRRYESKNPTWYSLFAPRSCIGRSTSQARGRRTWTGGLATQSVNILLGTGALLSGGCPRSESETDTAADGGASPLSSARPSCVASRRFRHELS